MPTTNFTTANQTDELIALANQFYQEYDVTWEVACNFAQAMYFHKRSGNSGRRRIDVSSFAQLLQSSN